MKITSSERISAAIALIFSFITGGLLIFSHSQEFSSFYLFVLFAMLLSFLLMYVAFYYTLNNFIIKKIKPLFDTIDTLQMPIEKLYESIEDGHLLTEIDNKVMEWAKSKVDEIAVLKSNEKYRKEFLGNVSHELKTPLFNIQGYILTLIDGGLEDDEINIKYLKRTDKNINRLISIVKDLETISKLETGERLLEVENIDIVKLITEAFEMQEIRTKGKNIEFKLDKKYKEEIIVRADKKAISDVLSNLLINSVIYGKDNGETIVSIEPTGNKVFISVKDNGIGIDEKHQQRIFERFFRVDKSRSKIQGGTGLGLSIVKHSIEAHKQSITVKSQVNEGTTFTFSLEKV
jgi:two-component system, OmpR family, phosphate regulon sensor histidine kinase PhoR